MMTAKERLAVVKNRPSGFDYMRLILATGVILLHAIEVAIGMDAAVAVWESWARPIVGIILPMFFALSGFLVAGSLERNRSLISFLGLRCIRLLPALTVEVVLSAVVFGSLFTTMPLRSYFSEAGFYRYFLNIIGNIHYALPGVFESNPAPGMVNSQLWTVPYELECYATLTVIAGVGMFRSRRLLLCSMVALQCLVIGRLLDHPAVYEPTVDGRMLVGSFLAGLTMFRWRDRLPWNRCLAIISGICLTGLLSVPPYGDFFISIPTAYLTVYLGLLNPGRQKFLLSGDYSYGMYLYGYPIQQAFTALGLWTHHWWLNMLVCWPLGFGAGAISWWFVEMPAQSLKAPLYECEKWLLRFGVFDGWCRRVFLVYDDTQGGVVGEGQVTPLPLAHR